MAFKLIDIENWERREFYEHFINEVVCTYSAVVNIDDCRRAISFYNIKELI